jgi:hypothetical protein
LLAGLDLKKINKWIGDPRRKPCAKSLTSATVLKLNLFTALQPKIHSSHLQEEEDLGLAGNALLESAAVLRPHLMSNSNSWLAFE